MSQTINDLRTHLFATLEGLRDKENPMDIERAKAVTEVAQTIINSAKVEVEAIKASGGSTGSRFLALNDAPDGEKPGVTRDAIKGTTTTVSLLEGARVTRHTAK